MNYPVEIETALHWGEMDAMGHINNVVYFKYFETARIDYFIKMGLENISGNMNEGPILANINCQYLKPLVFPDTVKIHCWVSRIGNTSLKMDYDVFSQQQNAIVAKGESIIVMIDYQTGNKIPVSEDLKKRIYHLQPGLKPS